MRLSSGRVPGALTSSRFSRTASNVAQVMVKAAMPGSSAVSAAMRGWRGD